MRLRICLSVATSVLILSAMTSAAEPGAIASALAPHSYSPDVAWGFPLSSTYYAPSLWAQGWPNYGFPFDSFGGHYLQPYGYSSTFPYLYFYEKYAHEAEESRRAAEEFEASLAREGKLTGPAKVGAFATDYLPFPPPGVTLILDGGVQEPSPSGAPLVIESGQHTLQISAKPGAGQTPQHSQ